MLDAGGELQVAARHGVAQAVLAEELRVADPGRLDAERERRGVARGVGDARHLHPAVLLLVAAVEPGARQELPIGADRGAAAVITVDVGLVLGADAERLGDAPRRTDAHRVALEPCARGQRRHRRRQSALHDHRQTGGRIEHLRAEAERAAGRAARDAAGEAAAHAEGHGEEAVALRADHLFMATHAEIEAQRLGQVPQQTDARRLAFAAAGVAVLAAPTVGVELHGLTEPHRRLREELFTTAGERRGGVVERGIGAAVGDARLGALALVRELGAQRLALHLTDRTGQPRRHGLVGGVRVDGAGAVRVLDDERRALAHAPGGVDRTQLIGGERVAVVDIGAADLEGVADAPLRIGAARPEVVAALVDLVADAQRDRVQFGVEGRQELRQQDAARERLEGVVDEPRQRPHAEDARGLVAVAHDHLDLLAAFEHLVVAQRVGAGPLARELLDDGAQRILEHIEVGGEVPLLVVQARAGGGAVPGAEAALLERGHAALAERLREAVARDEVAEHRVAAVLVDAHIELAARDGVEAAQRRVAVDRVHLVRRMVAQQALARVLVGVVGGGEQQVVADRALHIEGGARGGVGLAVVPAARPGVELTLEAVAVARGADQRLVAEVDDALDEARGDHVAHLGHERHDAGGLTAAGGDAHHDILCLGGREQLEACDAVDDRQLHAGRGAVGIAAARAGFVGRRTRQQHAAGGVFERGVAAGDRLAVGIEQTHHEVDSALAVGGHAVAVGLDDDAVHGAGGEDPAIDAARRERVGGLARQQQRIGGQHRDIRGRDGRARGGRARVSRVGGRDREDRGDGRSDGLVVAHIVVRLQARSAREVTACHGRLPSARRWRGSRVRSRAGVRGRCTGPRSRSAARGRPCVPSPARGSRPARGGPSPGR